MKKIGDHLPKFEPAPSQKGGPRNERDELLEYFFDRLKGPYKQHTKRNLTMRQLAVKLAHLKKAQDLYYLKSVCEDAERRGKPFSLVFWSELKVRP